MIYWDAVVAAAGAGVARRRCRVSASAERGRLEQALAALAARAGIVAVIVGGPRG
jgi:hypothetical protein